jgi:hypothetical protein
LGKATNIISSTTNPFLPVELARHKNIIPPVKTLKGFLKGSHKIGKIPLYPF